MPLTHPLVCHDFLLWPSLLHVFLSKNRKNCMCAGGLWAVWGRGVKDWEGGRFGVVGLGCVKIGRDVMETYFSYFALMCIGQFGLMYKPPVL